MSRAYKKTPGFNPVAESPRLRTKQWASIIRETHPIQTRRRRALARQTNMAEGDSMYVFRPFVSQALPTEQLDDASAPASDPHLQKERASAGFVCLPINHRHILDRASFGFV